MKKVLTYNGGQPLGLNNIDLIQDNVKQLTANISEAMMLSGESEIIVNGCGVEFDGSSTITISKGAIYKDGEVFIVDNQSVSASSLDDFYNTYYFDLSETTDTTVTFADSNSRDVHQYRKMIVTDSPSVYNISVRDIKSFKDIMYNYTNIDNIRNNDYVPTSSLTEIELLANQSIKEYELQDSQHIVKLDMSSDTILRRITPPNNVYDGYEIELRIRQNEDTFAIYDTNNTLGSTTGNLNLDVKYNTQEIAEYSDEHQRNETIVISTTEHYVAIRKSIIPKNKLKSFWMAKTGTTLASTKEGGIYEHLDSGEKVRLKLKWDADDNAWYETSRLIT